MTARPNIIWNNWLKSDTVPMNYIEYSVWPE